MNSEKLLLSKTGTVASSVHTYGGYFNEFLICEQLLYCLHFDDEQTVEFFWGGVKPRAVFGHMLRESRRKTAVLRGWLLLPGPSYRNNSSVELSGGWQDLIHHWGTAVLQFWVKWPHRPPPKWNGPLTYSCRGEGCMTFNLGAHSFCTYMFSHAGKHM